MIETKLEHKTLSASLLPDTIFKLVQYSGDVPPVTLAVEAGLPSRIRLESVTRTPDGDCVVAYRRLARFFTTSEVH